MEPTLVLTQTHCSVSPEAPEETCSDSSPEIYFEGFKHKLTREEARLISIYTCF